MNPAAEGYPVASLDVAIDRAYQRYRAKIEEHGPGKNWHDDNPEYHLWRATVHTTQASEPGEDFVQHVGDAINHLAMAADIELQDEQEFCQDDGPHVDAAGDGGQR